MSGARSRAHLALLLSVLGASGAGVVATLSSEAADWGPTSLLVALWGFAIASELLPIELRPRTQARRGWYFSTSAPFVLVATCLGAAPALAVVFTALAVSTVIERTPWRYALANAANHGVIAVSAALLTGAASQALDVGSDDLAFALLVVAAYIYILAVNLMLTVGYGALADGESAAGAMPVLWRGQMEAEAPLVLLTGLTAYGYATSGLGALVVLAGVQLWFSRSARELHRSVERGDRISELSASRNRLVEQILRAEEGERRRLAEALHDGAVQNLLAARQDLAEAEQTMAVANATSAIDATVEQLREEISELHPSVLAHVGLKAALESLAAAQARRGGFEATVEVVGAIPAQLEILTFTVCRELLVNATKHAHAEHAKVSVTRGHGHIAIRTWDDGRGFAKHSFDAALDHGHIGLASLSERVEALGGNLAIDSQPGRGASVTVVVPAPQSGAISSSRPATGSLPRAQVRTGTSA